MYGRYGHMADGTHKTVEDDLITDAVMVTKPCTADDYPSVKELHSGCDIRLTILSRMGTTNHN